LAEGQTLISSEEPISDVYFVEHGLVCLMSADEGEPHHIEAGMIGREGMVGSPTLLSPASFMYHSAVVQVSGEASRMAAAALHACMEAAPIFRLLLIQSYEVFLAQISQTASCNARHTLPQRLARWLLWARDRASRDDLPITQDFVALTLNVHRQRVNAAIHGLEQAGLVQIGRGRLEILDRPGLEGAACCCYARLRGFASRVSHRMTSAL